MKKHAKIFGSIGAAALAISFGALTTASDVSAVNPTGPSPASADVTVELIVTGNVPGVTIESPVDEAEYIGLNIPVRTVYTDTTRLVYTLTYVAPDETRTDYVLPDIYVADYGTASGINEITINVAEYGGKYGNYILSSRADGAGSTTDSVSLKLSALDFVVKGAEEKTNNPIITITSGSNVSEALVQVLDKDGNVVFTRPLDVTLDEDGETDVTLPLTSYGVPTDDYTVVITPYDASGNIVDVNRTGIVRYTAPDVPDVPDTGSFFGSIGLSRSDLVSTGIALLAVSVVFGILIVAKKNRDSKHRR